MKGGELIEARLDLLGWWPGLWTREIAGESGLVKEEDDECAQPFVEVLAKDFVVLVRVGLVVF